MSLYLVNLFHTQKLDDIPAWFNVERDRLLYYMALHELDKIAMIVWKILGEIKMTLLVRII